MKFMKMVALLLALVIPIPALGGCATPSTEGDVIAEESAPTTAGVSVEVKEVAGGDRITLRIVDWSDSTFNRREEFNKKYMEENPNIKIEYTMLPANQFEKTIIPMIKAVDGPDLFPVPTGMTLGTALKEEWYQPMNNFVTPEFRDSIDPAIFLEGITMQGDQWYTMVENMPVVNCLFYYNKDILKNAGVTKVPETYSEFIDACRKITEMGNGQVFGLVEGGTQLNRLDILVRSLAAVGGGKVAPYSKVLTVDGKAPYDSEAMIAAMALLAQLAADGSVHPDTINISAPEAREFFAQGQAGFICQGMWCILPWDRFYPDLNYGVMAVPVPDGGAKGGVAQIENSPWLGINKQSQHPREAAEYLMALFSEEGGYQSNCVADGNCISIIPSINEKYMSNEVMKEYYEIASATAKDVPAATTRDEAVYNFYTEVKEIQPSLGAIAQGVLTQSITDYSGELNRLSTAATVEWQRAAEVTGIAYDTFDFPNWDPTKDYTK